MQKEELWEYAKKSLEGHPYRMLANLGESLRGRLDKDMKLKEILSSCPEIEILVDPNIRERIAICKKGDTDSKENFLSTSKTPSQDSTTSYPQSAIVQSVIHAFTREVSSDEFVFIANQFPFKFKISQNPSPEAGWTLIESRYRTPCEKNTDALPIKTFNSVLKNIENWAAENKIDFTRFFNTKPKRHTKNCDACVLMSFIQKQPVDIQNRIVFSADIITALCSRHG